MNVRGMEVPRATIEELCRRRHIRRLAIFGSAVRGELRPESDIDVLVEFEPGHTPGFAFFDIQRELSEVLGRRVDLSTPQFLSPPIRSKVEAEAEIVFATE